MAYGADYFNPRRRIPMLSSVSALFTTQSYSPKLSKIKPESDVPVLFAPPGPTATAGKPVEAKEIPYTPVLSTSSTDKSEGDVKESPAVKLFNYFRDLFAAGDKRADVNHDQQLNVLDFMSFLNLYAAGQNPFAPPPPATDAASESPPVLQTPPAITSADAGKIVPDTNAQPLNVLV
jgi:hypothetical protein